MFNIGPKPAFLRQNETKRFGTNSAPQLPDTYKKKITALV